MNKNIQNGNTNSTEYGGLNDKRGSFNPDYRENINYNRQINREISSMPIAYPPIYVAPQNGTNGLQNRNVSYQIPPINLYINMNKKQKDKFSEENSEEYTDKIETNSPVSNKNHNYSLKEFPYEDRKALIKFGHYLGVNLNKHKYCIKYVLEAYNSALPDGWSKHIDRENTVYYSNKNINVVCWEHPTDPYYKNLIKEKKKEYKRENRCTIM